MSAGPSQVEPTSIEAPGPAAMKTAPSPGRAPALSGAWPCAWLFGWTLAIGLTLAMLQAILTTPTGHSIEHFLKWSLDSDAVNEMKSMWRPTRALPAAYLYLIFDTALFAPMYACLLAALMLAALVSAMSGRRGHTAPETAECPPFSTPVPPATDLIASARWAEPAVTDHRPYGHTVLAARTSITPKGQRRAGPVGDTSAPWRASQSPPHCHLLPRGP
jgi:hypothetical protein